MTKKTEISKIINESGCFNLQFRRDVRYKRPNKPTYYRWKAQFIVVFDKNQKKLAQEFKKMLGCGKIYDTEKGLRFTVQDIDQLYNFVIPFIKKYPLLERKKRDFKLWSTGVAVLFRYKGKNLKNWKRKDFVSLIKIQKQIQKFKERSKSSKWLTIAETFAKNLF